MNPPLTANPRRVPAAAGFAWLAQSLFLVRRQAGRHEPNLAESQHLQ